jgi:antitoxin ParD1/3/4
MMTVWSSGAKGKFVDEGRTCEIVGAASRELSRLDNVRAEQEMFERLKAELQHAFAAPEETYRPLTAAEVIARNG